MCNIKNNKLRKLFTNSHKYRENDNISQEKTEASIMEGFNGCTEIKCNEHGVNKSVLRE